MSLKVAWSADGQFLLMAHISIGSSGGFAVLDVGRARQVREFRTGAISHAAWHPKESRVATAGRDGFVRIWDVARDQAFTEFRSGTDAATHDLVAWSPDRRHVVSTGWWFGGRPDPLTFWQSDHLTRQLDAGRVVSTPLFCAAWSPDSRRLLVGDGTTATVLDIERLDQPVATHLHSSGVYAVAWRSDGERVASAGVAGSVRVWNPVNGELVKEFAGSSGMITSLDWQPLGKLLAFGGGDQSIVLWDTERGVESGRMAGHPGNTLLGIRFSPDGKQLASVGGFSIKIWDVESQREIRELHGHTSIVTGLAWHPDGDRLASCGFDQRVALWDVAMGQLLLALPTRGQFPRTVCWSPDGLHLLAGTGTHLTDWYAPPFAGEVESR